MLSPYRVIDLTDEQGLLCGQILADLGADVIHIEPPGGSSARGLGPFAGNESGGERSLYWWAYTRNERSLVLDIEEPGDRAELLRLIRGADFLIESERPGRLASLGLGYEDLAAENPGLIYVSITPFGQTGPKAQWLGEDLIAMAAGGHAYLTGEEDSGPLRVSIPQAHAHGATDAAVGALVAHFARGRSGRGQHVDISLQQSVTLATMYRSLDAPLEEAPARRISGGVYLSGTWISTRYALKDGSVVLGPAWLPSTGHFMKRLMNWAHDLGLCDDPAYLEEDWGSYALRMTARQLSGEDFEPVDRILETLFAGCTKAEIMQTVLERRLLAAPVLSLGEIIDGEQLCSREFVVEVSAEPAQEPIRYPGPFARFARTPIRYRLPAPRLDAHREEILAEPERVPAPLVRPNDDLGQEPFAGVKVLDLFWVLAGPAATRNLADYGATVVHVESVKHLDTLRVIPPYRFNHPHPEGSGGFQSANANKLGLSLDLHDPRSREIVLELAAWADVVTESFAPGVIESLGLGYESLREVNPGLIMISSCLMGQTGPWKNFSGFGNLAAALTGFQGVAGWPDRLPSAPHGAYTDFICARYNALAILAALEHRARTGEGQYIDQSQAEAALHFLAPGFLDYTVNGQERKQVGNADLELHPHGIYPCAGEDRWLAIAVATGEQWEILCRAMERPDLLGRRDAGADVLDAEISAWTRQGAAEELESLLQEKGVPAHRALDTTDLFECPQLRHREHYVEIGCDLYQTTTIENSRLLLSQSRPRRPEKALSFGRDNRLVLETLLGYTPEKIAALAEAGVLL
jgi:crotonobetainyl-CoA:carnitine CoA-transferase CaiB-like acyl-CoA transferase